MTPEHKMTANEFTNVKDIRGMFLYTKDGYIMSYLRVHYLNLDLLSEEERRSKTDNLSRSFEADRRNWVYTSFPREIDLDRYKAELKTRYQAETEHIGRRHILAEILLEGNYLATNGENYEHQHFIKLWKKQGHNRTDSEKELRDRVMEFAERYGSVGINTEVLGEQDIIRMCNLYGNAFQAAYDVPVANMWYEQIGRVEI